MSFVENVKAILLTLYRVLVLFFPKCHDVYRAVINNLYILPLQCVFEAKILVILVSMIIRYQTIC